VAGIARGLGELGTTARNRGDHAQTALLFEEAVQLYRGLGDRPGIAWSLGNLGHVSMASGDHEAAAASYDQSLALYRLEGDRSRVAASLANLGEVRLAQGDLASAIALCDESLAMFRSTGSQSGIGTALSLLAELSWRRGDYAHARTLCQQIVQYSWSVGEKRHMATGLEGLAIVAAAETRFETAARLFGAADMLRDVVGPPRQPRRAEIDRALSTVREVLEDRVFSTVWAEGRVMPPEQVLALALAPPEPAGPPNERPAIDLSSPLSRREREVATLVARGLSNRQIAERLVMSERTVHGHVASILAKLDFRSRSQIAVWAVHHGLAASAES
jgi:DNA-binding CsgD family transcriptional regulator/tetratricopeptide (TPR) repeat protein